MLESTSSNQKVRPVKSPDVGHGNRVFITVCYSSFVTKKLGQSKQLVSRFRRRLYVATEPAEAQPRPPRGSNATPLYALTPPDGMARDTGTVGLLDSKGSSIINGTASISNTCAQWRGDSGVLNTERACSVVVVSECHWPLSPSVKGVPGRVRFPMARLSSRPFELGSSSVRVKIRTEIGWALDM
ncbi:hypothetical protein VTK56DRAFT_3885 [Thermocarpiscus australiensis]